MAVKRCGEKKKKNIFPKTSAKSRIVFNSILKTDVRPIANIRLLYIFFCVHDFASHRSNFGHGTTKSTKNGFRAGRRMEKYVHDKINFG